MAFAMAPAPVKLQGVSIEDIRYDNARIDIEKIV